MKIKFITILAALALFSCEAAEKEVEGAAKTGQENVEGAMNDAEKTGNDIIDDTKKKGSEIIDSVESKLEDAGNAMKEEGEKILDEVTK